MARVLLVDDDVELCELLSEVLDAEGWEVESVHDGASAVQRVLSAPVDLVVLDVMLPELGGFDVLRRVREESSVPVVMLTARGEDVDRIVGLELGADDYLAKPFNPRELVARMRAVMRRADGSVRHEAVLRIGDLTVDPGARSVRRRGENVQLTGVEHDLLERLVREAGHVVARDTLFREVLGRRPRPFDRALDVHIANLRRKLGPAPGGGERIATIRGQGYQYLRSGG